MIKIIGDSTCDLSQAIVERYNIDIVSLNIIIGEEIFKDRIDIDLDDFYRDLKTFTSHPTTSMPSPSEFLEAYKRAYHNGHREILCICMSSGTSGSYQSAVLARNMFLEEGLEARIEVIDSYSMSLGSGLLILKSAQMQEEGYSFDEIVEYNQEYRSNVKHYLSVDDLDNLIKSGRLSNASAFLGKLLKVKPIMTMKNKKGAIVDKERGMKKVIQYYIREFKERLDPEENDFIIIGYTDNREIALRLEEALRKEGDYQGEILTMQKGAAVGTHVGSGGLSMFYIEKGHMADSYIRNKLKKRREQIRNLIEI